GLCGDGFAAVVGESMNAQTHSDHSAGAFVPFAASRHASTLRILKAARDLISEPARWTTGCMAKNSMGVQVDPRAPEAACFCAMGAIKRASRDLGSEWDARDALRTEVGNAQGSIALFNDNGTHAEIIAAWDRAIAKLEAQ